MSGNGYPKSIQNFLMKKLKTKYSDSSTSVTVNEDTVDNLPKIWIQRCLSIRLKEHVTRLSSSAVGEHFSECEHAQYLIFLQNQFTLLNDIPLPSDNLSPIEIVILNNYKILHSTKSNNYNILAFLEALLIKHNKPFLNTGLKASKELQLFT